MVTGIQIRAARSALNWSVIELSEKARVSTSTIKRIELFDGIPNSTANNVNAIKMAFEAAGIEFVGSPDDGPGIRIHSIQNPRRK